MLELKDICVSFRSERQDKLFGTSRDQVLFDVSLQVEKGSCLGILGETGSSACRQVPAQPSGGSRNCKEWDGDSIRAFEGRGIRRVQSGGDQRERSSGSFL